MRSFPKNQMRVNVSLHCWTLSDFKSVAQVGHIQGTEPKMQFEG